MASVMATEAKVFTDEIEEIKVKSSSHDNLLLHNKVCFVKFQYFLMLHTHMNNSSPENIFNVYPYYLTRSIIIYIFQLCNNFLSHSVQPFVKVE